jgi:hypothetical protein
MATKESLQIRELTARKTIREALEQMSALIGVELPTPISDPSPDPTYRNIVEWERVARDILALQAGLILSQPSIPGDNTANAAADINPTYTDAEAVPPPVEAAPIESVIDAEPTKAKGKKK